MIKHLKNGLLLRSISEDCASDRENLPTFYKETFGEAGDDSPDALAAWTGDLLSGQHPTVTGEDIWMVVDPAKSDKIVSAVLLIPQTWHYDDIPVTVGRVELVATDKEYRRRGLVSALMDAAHERSESLGHAMQAITGIPHYYRRFGYTMAVDLGIRSIMPLTAIPEPDKDKNPRYTLQPALSDDIPALAAWDAYRAHSNNTLNMIRDENLWRYELYGRSPEMPFALFTFVIVDDQKNAVGYVTVRAATNQKFFSCNGYVVGEKSSYLDTYDDVLRGMKQFIDIYYEDKAEFKPDCIYFDSSIHEAVDLLIQRTWGAIKRRDVDIYAWYVRVNDLARFIRHIAPVLERRLKDSGANNYTGTLTIGFYDLTGLEIEFANGKLIDANQRAFDIYEGDAKFPYLTFLNMLFGHRSIDELHIALPEVSVNRKAVVLLSAMFPQRRSWVYPLA